MQNYKGVLRELGQATTDSRFVRYTYIELGEEMLKHVYTYPGLDGKVRLELGNPVTLHLNGSAVVAVTTQDGKIYCTEAPGIMPFMGILALVIIGIIPVLMFGFGFGAYGLLFGALFGLWPILVAWKMFCEFVVMTSGSLPNAIHIPR